MLMRNYLIDSFFFKDSANKKMLKKIIGLSDREGCIRFFSHIINSQNKWMARILRHKNAPGMSWWDPVYRLNELEASGMTVCRRGSTFLEIKVRSKFFSEVEFIGYGGG